MLNAILITVTGLLRTIELDDTDSSTLVDGLLNRVNSNWYAVEDFTDGIWAIHGDSRSAHANLEASFMLRREGLPGIARGDVVFLGAAIDDARMISLTHHQVATVVRAWHVLHNRDEYDSLYQALLFNT